MPVVRTADRFVSSRSWLVSIVVAAASAAFAAAPPIELSAELAERIAGQPVPGLVAVVTDVEGVVAQGAAGVRVLGRPEPISPADRVHIGSITKPFTATVLATLVDQGKLRWDETLTEALPDLAPAMRPEYRAVTLAQLLSHEAGIQPFVDDASPEVVGIPALEGDARAQRLRFAVYALSLAPVEPPGSQFRYSNGGFAIAAAVAEQASQRSWEELVRERVFAHLGMATAGFGWPNVRDPAAPWGHVALDGKLAPTAPDDPYRLPPWIAPAGDLSMSLLDLARFARAHLLGFDGRSDLLRPETFRTLHTRRIRGGLGWGVSSLLGHEPVSTFSGSGGTFLAMVALVHDADLAVMVAANSADEAAEAAVKTTLKSLVARFAGDKTPLAPAGE